MIFKTILSFIFTILLVFLLVYALVLIFGKPVDKTQNGKFKFWGTLMLSFSLIIFYLKAFFFKKNKQTLKDDLNKKIHEDVHKIKEIEQKKDEVKKLIEDTEKKIDEVDSEIKKISATKEKVKARKNSKKTFTEDNIQDAVDKLKNL